ncbi:MAG: dephospho-CoA kinase [Cellvibrionaceae bacterium]|jgi:dephospho-CoA kinase
MPFILGVTGGIGSGKSAATDHFFSLGIHIVDADVIAHQLVARGSPLLLTIKEHFGDDILLGSDELNNAELNRVKLREIVFNNPQEKKWLENLLHPLIRKKIRAELAAANSHYAILSAPLLFENNLQLEVDRVLVIDCDESLQYERASLRDNSDREMIKKIMQQQLDRNTRLARADDVIENMGSLADLKQSVEHYHHQLDNHLV